jgi:multidrug efflux pump subunit AcrB
MIWRWDRRRAITVGAVSDGLATKLFADVRPKIEAIPLPPGYSLMWDGEYRSSGDSQRSLIPGMIPAFILVVLIIMALFNSFRPLIIILATVPFVLIGVVAGLLITGENFGFVALLGTMSLAGMMIKNGIVLLDQAKIESEDGKTHYEAITAAAISRLRPVVLAAATTVLGVMPLLPDVFWVSLAVAIMFGLSFGTVLTMIVIPALYSLFYRLPRSPETQVPATSKPAPALTAERGKA